MSSLVWFALSLTVLCGMAGFATDLAYWYLTASRAQNAADAAALGGVVFLPATTSPRPPRWRQHARHDHGYSGRRSRSGNQAQPAAGDNHQTGRHVLREGAGHQHA